MEPKTSGILVHIMTWQNCIGTWNNCTKAIIHNWGPVAIMDLQECMWGGVEVGGWELEVGHLPQDHAI